MKTDLKDIALVLFITFVGLYIRVSAPLTAAFPLNDGGLFYRMMLDIQENHFALPAITSYNNANIPFAYPPLAFYLYVITSNVSHIPIIKLMQFGPAIISALSILAFFLLAKELLESKEQVLISTLVFAFIPRAFEWLIMGGGTTRSLGFLLAILAMRQYVISTKLSSTRNTIQAMLYTAFVILTHPEAAVHLFISSSALYLSENRSLEKLRRFSIKWFGGILISMPWWLIVIIRHGFGPYFSALTSSNQDSYNFIARILILFRFNFTDEPYLTLISVLGLIGIFAMLKQQKVVLPVWFMLTQLLEPRGGGLYMMLPLSVLAGYAISKVVLPVFVTGDTTKTSIFSNFNLRNGFIAFIFLYSLLSASTVSNKIVRQFTLTKDDLNALAWVRDNTPANSQFAIITQGNPLNDATSEWFPALTNRISVATIFGHEWDGGSNFDARITSYKTLQQCAIQNEGCIDQWIEANNREDITYIYIQKQSEEEKLVIIENLKMSINYKNLYETGRIIIFQKYR